MVLVKFVETGYQPSGERNHKPAPRLASGRCGPIRPATAGSHPRERDRVLDQADVRVGLGMVAECPPQVRIILLGQ
jgi:hypothetical protein